MKRHFFTAVILSALVFLLTGCAGKVPEKQIRADITANDSYLSSYDMEILEYSESRHETNRDTGRDAVQATVTAAGDVFEFQCEYLLYYTKHSNGWKLNRISQDLISVSAKQTMDTGRIREDAQALYRDMLSQYSLTTQEFGQAEPVCEEYTVEAFMPYCVYRIPFTGENGSLRVDAQLIVGYTLDHEDGWKLHDSVCGYRKYATEITCTPISDPQDVLPRIAQEQGLESYEILSETKDSDTRYTYQLRGSDTDSTKYATMIYEYEVTCSFDQQEGWQPHLSRYSWELVDAIPHVQGTWLYDDGTGLNRYEIYVERMDLDTITLSYNIIMTDYEGAETRYLSSNGLVTMDVNAKREDGNSLCISMAENIAGPEGRGAGAYRLWFYNYEAGHEDFEESGFKLSGEILKKIG